MTPKEPKAALLAWASNYAPTATQLVAQYTVESPGHSSVDDWALFEGETLPYNPDIDPLVFVQGDALVTAATKAAARAFNPDFDKEELCYGSVTIDLKTGVTRVSFTEVVKTERTVSGVVFLP